MLTSFAKAKRYTNLLQCPLLSSKLFIILLFYFFSYVYEHSTSEIYIWTSASQTSTRRTVPKKKLHRAACTCCSIYLLHITIARCSMIDDIHEKKFEALGFVYLTILRIFIYKVQIRNLTA